MACKQKDAAYLTDEASMQEGEGGQPSVQEDGVGVGVKPACRRVW